GASAGTGRVLRWIPAESGLYAVGLRVRTGAGVSDSVTFNLWIPNASHRPTTWLAQPQPLPGIVEAEYFDETRFSDYNANNQGGQLRATAVDLGVSNGRI